MQQRRPYFYSRDLDLSAALVQLGFRLNAEIPMSRTILASGRHEDVYWFETTASTEFGELQAKQVMDVWTDRESRNARKLAEDNPDAFSAIEQMIGVCANRRLLLEAMKTRVTPMVEHEINGWKCQLPINASEDLRRRMAHMIREEAV